MRIGLILVAAGYGSVRKDSDGQPVSKLLEEVGGVPLLFHPLRTALQCGISEVVVVVNPLYGPAIECALDQWRERPARMVLETAVQPDRYGAADAVCEALPRAHRLGMSHALIVYGDMPLWSVTTMGTLIRCSAESDAVVTMLTVERGAIEQFDRYGRVIRDSSGVPCRIVEMDSPGAADVFAVGTVNPSLWVWDLEWLARNIKRVAPVERPDGRARELYMPPLVAIAHGQRCRIREVPLSADRAHEAYGVNTIADLQVVRKCMIC